MNQTGLYPTVVGFNNQYYEEETSISYSTPVLILTIMAHQLGGHKNHPVILMVTTLHCPTQQMYSTGMHEVEGKELYYMGANILVRKPDLLKVEKPERDGNITDNE